VGAPVRPNMLKMPKSTFARLFVSRALDSSARIVTAVLGQEISRAERYGRHDRCITSLQRI